MKPAAIVLVALVGCGDPQEPITLDLALDEASTAEVTRTFEVAGSREVHVLVDRPIVVEAWADNGAIDGTPEAQLAAGASPSWMVPHSIDGDFDFTITASGTVRLAVYARGTPPPLALRARALAWFDGELLDDRSVVSFASVMAAISDDHHGGQLLARWFAAFAAGPGAGRATFAQWKAEIEAAQGTDPTAWDLDALPFKVTGVHDRHDLGRGVDCGELRVSIASTHPTFSPVHLIFLFRQPIADDDITPDGAIHCRGSARRWARLSTLDAAAWKTAARDLIAEGVTHDRFKLAESVELSISPWQWRQWQPDGNGNLTNPPLFQTVDVDRANTPGPARDSLLAAVRANAPQIAARTWLVPPEFRGAVAEVQPNAKAPLVDLTPLTDVLATYPTLPRAIGMMGCPRCHTDDADFIQTSVDRKPSPFYDRELDARAARLDALDRGEFPGIVPFGPLQPL
jgi:hypothetical protein